MMIRKMVNEYTTTQFYLGNLMINTNDVKLYHEMRQFFVPFFDAQK